MDSLGGNRSVYLCCLQIGVSEHTAYRLYRYTCRERDERCKGVAGHVKCQRAFHADVSLYVMHAIVDNVLCRYIKDKSRPYSSVTIHDCQSRRKHLYTVRGLGLHPPALDADLALFQDDIFLPEIAHIGDCQT